MRMLLTTFVLGLSVFSFSADGKTLHANRVTAKKFNNGTPVWEAEGKVALGSEEQKANITNIAQNCKFTPGYHVYKTKEKYSAC